jgi:transcriptional regulator with XRE-family HTH domain
MSYRNATAHQVAAEVRAALARASKRQRELGDILGVSPQAAGRRLSGGQPFTVAEVCAVADWLNVPVASFFPESREAS